MQDLGGNSFNLSDFLNRDDTRNMTKNEQISSLLGDLGKIEIKEKVIDKDYDLKEDEMDTFDKPNSSVVDSMAGTLDLHFDVAKTRPKRKTYSVLVEDNDDIYVPMKGETKPRTEIHSIEDMEDNTVVLLSQGKQTNVQNQLNEDVVFDLNVLTHEAKSTTSSQSIPLNDTTLDSFNDVNTKASSDDLFASLGISTSTDADTTTEQQPKQQASKQTMLKKKVVALSKPQLGARSVDEILSSVDKKEQPKKEEHETKSKTSPRSGIVTDIKKDTQQKPKKEDKYVSKKILKDRSELNEQIEDDDIDIDMLGRASINTSNDKSKEEINKLLNSLEQSGTEKEEKTEEDMVNAVQRTTNLLNSLDNLEVDISITNKVNADSVAKTLAQQLEDELKTTGKRMLELPVDTVTVEVGNELRTTYNLDVRFLEDHYTIAYKKIPKSLIAKRTPYLQKLLLVLRDCLLRVNHNYQATGNKRMQIPIIFDCSDNGILSVTDDEMEQIKATISSTYLYELQNNQLLIWGVR